MSPAAVDKTKDFLLNSRFSDMKITCHGQTFNVHRFIIYKQSPFFETALSGPFKESAEQTVDLPEDDPETIERVVSYLYMSDYLEDGHIVPLECGKLGPRQAEDNGSARIDDDSARVIGHSNVHVYIAADKFGIVNLKTLAKDKFAHWANANWDSLAFIEMVQEVMSTVPPHDFGLQDVVADVISKHVVALVKKGAISQLEAVVGYIGSAIIGRVMEGDMLREPGDVLVLKCLEQIVQNLNRSNDCRHCSMKLNVDLEDGEYQYGTSRCASCRTRHGYLT